MEVGRGLPICSGWGNVDHQSIQLQSRSREVCWFPKKAADGTNTQWTDTKTDIATFRVDHPSGGFIKKWQKKRVGAWPPPYAAFIKVPGGLVIVCLNSLVKTVFLGNSRGGIGFVSQIPVNRIISKCWIFFWI